MLVEENAWLTQSKFSSGLGTELSEIPFRDPIFASKTPTEENDPTTLEVTECFLPMI